MTATPTPTAQQVLAVLAAEHRPFDRPAPTGRSTVRYCTACSAYGTVVHWPCRIHQLATQPTVELVALGARVLGDPAVTDQRYRP